MSCEMKERHMSQYFVAVEEMVFMDCRAIYS